MSARTKRAISYVSADVRKEIAANASSGFIGGALAGEGYAGGYIAALNDVLLVLNGVEPGGRYGRAWTDAMRKAKKAPPKATSSP